MKRLLLVSLLFATCNAHAFGGYNNGAPNANAGAIGLGVGVGVGTGGNATGVGGNVDSNVNVEAADYGDLRQVPPAIAPSVFNTNICPIVVQGSAAGSVFFFSGSGTTDPKLVAICVAYHLNQPEVVEAMTCNASKEYRQANPNCATLKPATQE